MDVPNISLDIPKTEKKKTDEQKSPPRDSVSMSVSPICMKDGKRVAYVEFLDGDRKAEGEIPECRITSYKGFSENEAAALEDYMKRELPKLKKMAAGINVLDALMGKNG